EGAERRLLMPDRGILPGFLDQPRSSATQARRLLVLACLAVLASAPSNAGAATRDTTCPSMPTAVTAWAVGCNQINLAWNASTDTGGSGLRGYNVYRNGVYLKQVLTPATSSSDGGLAASTVYSYAVKAVDNAGNASAMSTTASSNTPGCPVSGGPWAKGF